MARIFYAAVLAAMVAAGCSQFPIPPTTSAPAEGIEIHFFPTDGRIEIRLIGESNVPINLTVVGKGSWAWWLPGGPTEAIGLHTSGFDQKTGFALTIWEIRGDAVLFWAGTMPPEPIQQFSSTAFTAVDANGNLLEVFLTTE